MLIQLAFASFMVMITVLIHLVGLVIIIRIIRSQPPLFHRLHFSPLTVLLGATVGVFAIHSIDIWLYVALYLAPGALGHFEEALYFSTVTYALIGYGDVLMPHAWRVLGAIEGATGIIMLGWSTAFLVSLLSQLKLFGHDWLTPTP